MIDLLRQLYGVESRDAVPLSDDLSALTLELALEAAAEELKLRVQDNIVASIVAALRGGKHVLLTGPPGTGKTSLAQAVAAAAERAGLSYGTILTTGTSDWTAADTVGGYWPSREDTSILDFRPGVVLAAIDGKKWAIIDELNRADIDKAIGQLFTTLGQAVVLPYDEDVDGAHLPVSIVPPEVDAPVGTSPHRVPGQWRVIATLNTRDRDLLFTLSYALMRRFAVIDVPVPTEEEYLEILKEKGDTGSPDANARIRALLDLPHRKIGPAILIHVAAFVRERLSLVPGDVDGALAAAILAFVLPQLDDLARPQQADVTAFLVQHVLKGLSAIEVASVVSDTFHASPRTSSLTRNWPDPQTLILVLNPSEAPSSAPELAASVRKQAWSYLDGHSRSIENRRRRGRSFSQLPRGDIRRLAAVHAGTSSEAGEMLGAAEHVLRECRAPLPVHGLSFERQSVRPCRGARRTSAVSS